MKKRVMSFVLLLAMLATVLPSVVVTAATTTPEIKNVIYLIPDGGGYGPYDFADMVKQAGGFSETKYSNKTPTNTDPLTMKDHLIGSIRTAPYGGGITDSAAAGTALATGHKTYNGRIGVDANGKPVANLVEAAQSLGKATGLIATYEWMHATPASFSAHAMDRNDYYNMYQQIENQGIEVVLGTGYGAVGGYATIQNARDRGYTIISNKSQLQDVEPGDKLWGNMADSMPYDINLSSSQATLAEMTDAAITALSGDEDGFFLMVEGSKVDTGGHANDAVVTTSEYLAFDAAFKVAVDFAKGRTDTVVICAPDHDTGGMRVTSNMASEVAKVQGGSDPNTISWESTNHTGQNVGVWMYVPEGVSVVNGLNSVLGDTPATRTNYVVENTALAPYVADLFGVDLAELTEELFVDVTNIGTYSGNRFAFNRGNKYVFANQSVYYKEGQQISMDGQVAVVVNNRVYVPASIVEEEDWDYVAEGYDGFAGSGTAKDPYIMADEYDFIEFTSNVLGGNRYDGKYFKQTADLDLADYGAYTGMGKTCTFAGIYDGDGHEINVALITNEDHCIFPYVEGKIMNLGTTGSITGKGTGFTGGIARSLRPGASIVNCYSTADLSGYDVSGIAGSSYSMIANCYFAGTISGRSTHNAMAYPNSGAAFSSCYYVSGYGAGQSADGIMAITKTSATTVLAKVLNRDRQAAATASGVDASKIMYWEQADGNLPTLFHQVSTVTGVTVTPSEATVNKGGALQLTATVTGENDPSQAVHWSIEPASNHAGTYITEDGYLVIDQAETRETFTILAKSAQNGSISGISTITVGQEVETTQDGSQLRPYLIEDEEDFLAFTNAVLGGEQYSGKYFKQTEDLDMAGYPGYNGMGKAGTFDGVYDGGGHVINVAITTNDDQCVFPYITGTLMNLGTTGTLTCTGSYAAGIVRSLRPGGKVINCYSTMTLAGNAIAGVVWSNYGEMVNCYFGGMLNGNGTNWPISQTSSSSTTGTYANCYYVSGCGGTQGESGISEITTSVATSSLATSLNSGRANAATLAGVAESGIAQWTQDEGALPRFAGSEDVIRPDGSKERPFLIEDEADFLAFTNNVRSGNKYQGIYFKQTADLDMAGYPGYTGMGSAATFAGTYDGDGHVINFAIDSTGDECPFPYTTGVIMNLGTTGSVKTASFGAAIARSLRAGSKMVNCWSSADVEGNEIGGLAWTNYGTMVNSYYSGDQTWGATCHEMAWLRDGATAYNNYYLGTTYSAAEDVAEITETELTGNLVKWLNEGREKAAKIVGYETDELVEWMIVANQGPRHKIELVAASMADVDYQDGSVVGNIVFDLCLTDCTAYVGLYDAGNKLVAIQQITITEGDDAEDFALTYTLADDTTYTLKLLLWDEIINPLALPDITTVSK